jgi:prepilin peptidase CpaA
MANLVQLSAMVVALAVIVYAMLSDFASLRIPNALTLGLALLFVPAALAAGLPWRDLLIDHLGTAAAMLAVGLVVFARGWMGGGDVKMLVAIGLWTGAGELLPFLVATALIGGGLALFALFLRYPPGALLLDLIPPLRRGFGDGRKIPYGLAIGAAAILIAPSLDTFPPEWRL